MKYWLTRRAREDLEKLSPKLVSKIQKKIKYFLSAPNPLKFAKPLVNLPPATHRFRIGKLRVKFFYQEKIFHITHIQFRGKVYRRQR